MKRPVFVVVLGALAAFAPGSGAAQSRLFPKWEIPGFDFRRDGAFRKWARAVAERRATLLHARDFSTLNAAVARGAQVTSATAVAGTVQVPAVLFAFKNTVLPGSGRDTSDYTNALFGASPPLGRPYTVRTFYEQMSNGLLSMQGHALGYAMLDSNEVTYAGAPPCFGNPAGTTNCNGLFTFSGGQTGLQPEQRMQVGLREALRKVDSVVAPDWSQFTYDAATGIISLVIFVQPAEDGACAGLTNNHLWSHRSVLANTAFTLDSPYVTKTGWPGHTGQFLTVVDYTLQSGVGGATACDTTKIMPIGTAAHETGHGFGLPDLYDTRGTTDGIGEWGLMSASYYTTPLSPGRMEAWSLSQLGWVTVAPITTAGTYSFGPAPTADSTWMIRPTGSNPRGEYFLLENRQAWLADTALVRIHGGGLMIWHVDSEQIVQHGFTADNTVNYGPIHGLRLEEADGLAQLNTQRPTGQQGDPGDPYPGTSGNTVFDSTANPSAVKNADGKWVGWRIDSIKQLTPNGPMSFRVVYPTALVLASGATRPNGVMGAAYYDTLKATGGTGFYSWAVTAGALPTGVTLSSGGVLSGFVHVTGAFSYTATARSGGQQMSQAFSFSTTAPTLLTADVVNQLFTGSPLNADQLRYLDYLGNNNGLLDDVGDFLAWVNATGAPLAARRSVAAAAHRVPPKKGGRP